MKNIILTFFKNHHLEIKNKTIVVGVSTGVDSMVLLSSLLDLAKDYSLKVVVAHYNHQKRAESLIEQQFIVDYCQQANIELIVGQMDKKVTGNFQAEARKNRYLFFNEVCQEVEAHYLALAHHGDDLMETIIMRILRGSNLHGYSGMDQVGQLKNITLIRPLLDMEKQELLQYAQANNIKYFEDASNLENTYTRNRIRHQIIPALKNEQKSAIKKFASFSKTLKAAHEIINLEVKKFVEQNCQSKENGYQFFLSEFSKQSLFIQKEIIFALFKPYDLSESQVEQIIKGLNSSRPNIEQVVKKNIIIRKEYNEISIITKPDFVWEGTVTIAELGTYKINDIMTVIVKKSDENTLIMPDEIWYNSHMLPFVVRTRKPGDNIKLEAGTKKINDLLIDLKVKSSERKKVLVLEKQGEILAVFGFRKSVKLKEMENCDIIIKVEENHG
jgi:tRNA(Ile)-lysidine synthetase-like protein